MWYLKEHIRLTQNWDSTFKICSYVQGHISTKRGAPGVNGAPAVGPAERVKRSNTGTVAWAVQLISNLGSEFFSSLKRDSNSVETNNGQNCFFFHSEVLMMIINYSDDGYLLFWWWLLIIPMMIINYSDDDY